MGIEPTILSVGSIVVTNKIKEIVAKLGLSVSIVSSRQRPRTKLSQAADNRSGESGAAPTFKTG